MLGVVETFLSLQGESTYAGKPCFFIRLAGCNLDCVYCDSRYAAIPSFTASTDELVQMALKHPCRTVEITGGEPLLHQDTPTLCRQLLDAGFTVLVETNGSCNIDLVPRECVRIMDRKLPDSGMAEFHDNGNYSRLTPADQVKFVVSGKEDFDFAVSEIKKFSLDKINCELIVSPVWGKMDFKELAQLVIDSALPLRMQLQLHKIIWGDIPGV